MMPYFSAFWESEKEREKLEKLSEENVIIKSCVYNLLHATLILVPLLTLTVVSFSPKSLADIWISLQNIRWVFWHDYDAYNEVINADNEVKTESNCEDILEEVEE